MGVFTGSDDYEQEEQMSVLVKKSFFCETIVKAQRAEPQMDVDPHMVAFVQLLLATAFVLF